MKRTDLPVRAAIGAAWISAGFAPAFSAQRAVGAQWEVVACYAFFGTMTDALPCGLFAVPVILAASCLVGVLLWLLDERRRPAPHAMLVYVGTVVATWTGSALVPAVACSLLVAALTGVEVRRRRLGRWWLLVPCMVGWCFVELIVYGVLLAFAGL